MNAPDLKNQLIKALTWESAHVNLESAVANLTLKTVSATSKNFPYSIWQLLEHLRITQKDIIDYCIEEKYEEKNWPEDYWPINKSPESLDEVQLSLKNIKKDLAHLVKFIKDPSIDLLDTLPKSKDHTYLRELLILIDHTSYHTGQIVLIRKIFGEWD